MCLIHGTLVLSIVELSWNCAPFPTKFEQTILEQKFNSKLHRFDLVWMEKKDLFV